MKINNHNLNYVRSTVTSRPEQKEIKAMLEKANLNSKTESNRMQLPCVNNY